MRINTLAIIFIFIFFDVIAQKKWQISGQISYESIKESKDFKNSKENIRFVYQELSIDTTLLVETKIGRGLALNFLLERFWKDFSLGIGLNFIPNRTYTTKNLPFILDTQVLAVGEQRVSWQSELELPIRARYYFRIPKYKLKISPSLGFMIGTTKNYLKQQLYDYPEFNKSIRTSESEWLVQRIAYQLDLSIFYEFSDFNFVSLGYYRQRNLISSDERYIIAGVRLGLHKAF
jgi:hypothetical protein